MSSEDLMTKFDEMVKRFKQEFNEIIESERAKMKAEVEAYNAEKERMNAVQVNDDDIIKLNVGGQKMTTTRSTLCQVEGSLLASMFSGRWEDGLSRDEKGYVFFDFNPQYFVVILDYLRTKKIAGPENPVPLPKVPEDQLENFNKLVEYLGLSDEIIPGSEIVPGDVFNLHSEGVTLEEGGKVAVRDSSLAQHKYVLGKNVYQQGVVRFKLKLESFKDNFWMFVGIVKVDHAPQNNTSSTWPDSYGWAPGSRGGVFSNGSITVENTLRNLSKQGDTVELVLDCDAAKLSLHLPTGQQFQMDIPKIQNWRLNANLFNPNDKIRIISE